MPDPLEQLSDSDLAALSKNDLHSMSDQGLQILAASGKPAPAPKPAEPSAMASGARQGLSGFAGGLDDELSGVVGAAGRVAGVKNLGTWKPLNENSHLETASPTLNPSELMDAYRGNRDDARAEQHQDIAAHPWVSTAANVAGMVANPLLRAAGPVQAGAIQGFGNSEADVTQGDVVGALKDTATGAGEGYIAGQLGKGLGKILPKVAEDVAPMISKEVETGLVDEAGKPITKTVTQAAPLAEAPAPNKFVSGLVKKGLTAVGAKLGGPIGAVLLPDAAKAVTPIITGAANGLNRLLQSNPEQFGKWASVLTKAAARGETSLNASVYVLQQQDPEFRQKMQDLNTPGASSIGSAY